MNQQIEKHGCPKILILLPVRNGSRYLQGFFDNVIQFANGVIALDDGSDDDTLDFLRRETFVLKLLINPSRATFAGWDDAANRRRLLEACAEFNPEWVMWLDADERIVRYDIPHINKLFQLKVSSSPAYGFEVIRLIGDENHYDKAKLWTYRMFRYASGLTLPKAMLHFEPIPIQYGQESLIRTRIRIAHLAGVHAKDRVARYRKYQEVDPDHQWQDDYSYILDPPGHCWLIKPLPSNVDLVIDYTRPCTRRAP